RARATIGGPSLESRAPCNAAAFQRSTTLSPVSSAGVGPRAHPRLGTSSNAPPAPAHFKSCRREIPVGSADIDLTLQENFVEGQPGDLKDDRRAWSTSPHCCGERQVVAGAEARDSSRSMDNR